MGGEMRRWRSHHRSDYCDQGGLSVLGTLPVTSRALRCIGQEGVKKVGNTCKRVEKKLVRKKARCSTLGVVQLLTLASDVLSQLLDDNISDHLINQEIILADLCLKRKDSNCGIIIDCHYTTSDDLQIFKVFAEV